MISNTTPRRLGSEIQDMLEYRGLRFMFHRHRSRTMFFFFRWRSGPKTRTLNKGHFNCPRCESRQPCRHFQVYHSTTLFGIPSGGGQDIRQFIRCDACKAEYPAANYSFRSDADEFIPVKWDCPFCRSSNPNTTYRCRACDRSLV